MKISGVSLPPARLRTSEWHKADDDFLETGRREVQQLIDDEALSEKGNVLDIGCGPGRFAIALLDRWPWPSRWNREYRGVDIMKNAIDWCKANIGIHHDPFRFIHLDRRHRRYSGRGAKVPPTVPIDDGWADLVYLFSVVSHMERSDLPGHLGEFERVLAPGGRIVLTGFIVDEDVPEYEENPPIGSVGVGRTKAWRGPLHCVRYRRDFFERELFVAGLVLDAEPRPNWDPTGQTRLVIKREGDL